MNKDIEWKKTEINYEKLNKITHKDIQSSITLKKYRKPEEGGKVGGPKTKELGVGIHGLSQEERIENSSNGGKASAAVGGPSKAGKANTSESQSEKNRKRKTLGHPPTTSIQVYRFDTNEYVGEYKSISECARILDLDKGNISKLINGIKSAGSNVKGFYFLKK